MVFGASPPETLWSFYCDEYPISPDLVLKNAKNQLQNYILKRWKSGFCSLIEKIQELLKNFTFFDSREQVYARFNKMVYKFYEERLQWAYSFQDVNNEPSVSPQFGLRAMNIREYGEPYYFPWDEGEFFDLADFEWAVYRFLRLLSMPLTGYFTFCAVLKASDAKASYTSFIETTTPLMSQICDVFADWGEEGDSLFSWKFAGAFSQHYDLNKP